jgi:anaerobic selenocysteine-containing dehydrogenase
MEKQWKHVLEDGTEVVRTCAWSPPGCHPVGCGLKLFIKDGKLIKVEGDPEHPITQGRLCVRCLSLPEYVNHPNRILYPMKRAKEDRGKDKWERITWDEAWSIIIDNYNRIKEKFGPESIINLQGTGREASMYCSVLEKMGLGTPNGAYTQSGWSCYGPRIAITSFILGAGFIDIDWAGCFPDRYDNPKYEIPKYIVLWGKAPLASNPDGMFGHAVIDLMKRGTKIITVDPRMHWLATRAEHALQLRPGTDTALALAFLNVIINEDLYDHEFVEKWCYGFEELKERVQEYPPSKVAEITWIPEKKIIEVARLLATAKPVSLGWGLAVDQNANGVQLGQSLLALTAITGNLDVPGGTSVGVMLPGVMNPQNFPIYLPDELWRKTIGSQEYPAVLAALQKAQPDVLLETLETGQPYPIKMAWIQSSNTIAPTNSAQPKRWHQALKKLDFVVASDIFMNPTIMAFADIFLPLATFPEHDGLVITNYGLCVAMVGAINKAMEMGECKSDIEIFFELVKRTGAATLSWDTPQEYFDEALAGAKMSFDELREAGVWQPGWEYKKYEKGLLRPDGQPGFNTVTGKVELYSTVYENFGDDPLPYYQEPPYSHVLNPELAEKYPLILTTGSRHFTSFHSEHRQIPTLREIDPDPIVEIHPDTAAKFGIKEGDWVCIENMFGKAKEKAHLTPIVPPSVINAAHGWWFPEKEAEEPSLFGVWESNINNLIPHRAIGKMGFGAPYKSMICTISKAD